MSPWTSLRALVRALHDVSAALVARDEQRANTALERALGELGTAYACIGAGTPSRVARHLISVLDACLHAIGSARPGATESLDACIALLSSIEQAMSPAQASPPAIHFAQGGKSNRVSYRPSTAPEAVAKIS